jgi:hypothetical protein
VLDSLRRNRCRERRAAAGGTAGPLLAEALVVGTNQQEVIAMPREETLFLYPKTVRGQVLAQHEQLRALLFEALDQTGRCLQGQRELARLALLVLQVRRRFRAHLAFEERKLFPILAQVDLWGPERVAALSLEHAQQRGELDTLVRGMREGWGVQHVAVALRSLATDLLIDMAEEEQACLNEQLLGDEIVSVAAAL